MGKDVYANGNAISCKAGDGKVIAAFPDVCNSPPSPPAGPIPVPYPDSSFSKDLKEGSSSVKIGGKPAALKDQSYFKTSPLGDEAATRTFGGSLITHTITGKTYFGAWSMDVMFEGKNVCRHLDITTSNHSSYPGSTPPFTELENMALLRVEEGKCPCCKRAAHATGTPMNRDEWYEDVMKEQHQTRQKELEKKLEELIAKHEEAQRGNPKKLAKIEASINDVSTQFGQNDKNLADKKSRYNKLIHDAKTRPGCTCGTPKPPLLPSPPCDVFYQRPPPGEKRKAQQDAIEEAWNKHRAKSLKSRGRPAALVGVRSGEQVNHLTPKSAGGCPTGDGNLQAHEQLCPACQTIDGRFNEFQS